jgi:antitoxin ParD1/3/4
MNLSLLPIIGILAKKGENMSKNTSISLGNYFDDFIKNILKNGRYKNASEVIRAGLRLLEAEENKVIMLRNAIQEGIDSGHDTNFDSNIHLKRMKKEKKLNG